MTSVVTSTNDSGVATIITSSHSTSVATTHEVVVVVTPDYVYKAESTTLASAYRDVIQQMGAAFYANLPYPDEEVRGTSYDHESR